MERFLPRNEKHKQEHQSPSAAQHPVMGLAHHRLTVFLRISVPCGLLRPDNLSAQLIFLAFSAHGAEITHLFCLLT